MQLQYMYHGILGIPVYRYSTYCTRSTMEYTCTLCIAILILVYVHVYTRVHSSTLHLRSHSVEFVGANIGLELEPIVEGLEANKLPTSKLRLGTEGVANQHVATHLTRKNKKCQQQTGDTQLPKK